jgi:hypothetical protein
MPYVVAAYTAATLKTICGRIMASHWQANLAAENPENSNFTTLRASGAHIRGWELLRDPRIVATGGYLNPPCSSRFQNSTARPEPSHATIFILSARLARNTKFVPENASCPSISRTSATRPSARCRKSIGRVATVTQISTAIISPPPRPAAHPTATRRQRRAQPANRPNLLRIYCEERGTDLVCVDNFFVGGKRNIAHSAYGDAYTTGRKQYICQDRLHRPKSLL